jgi:hypothetical protein
LGKLTRRERDKVVRRLTTRQAGDHEFEMVLIYLVQMAAKRLLKLVSTSATLQCLICPDCERWFSGMNFSL